MSIILKTQPANSVSSPAYGKRTIFFTDEGDMKVKAPNGNVTTVPSFSSSGNTQVVFNDNGSVGGNAGFTFTNSTGTLTVANLTVTQNISAGNLSVSSLANGNSNVSIPSANGNVAISVGGTSNVLVISNTNAVVTGALSTTGNITAGNVYANSGTIGASSLAGTLTTAAQPNITSIGTLGSLSVTGNVTAGNLVGRLANGNSNISIAAANGNITFAVAGSERMRIESTGNVLIGTSTAPGSITAGIQLGAVTNGTVSAQGNANTAYNHWSFINNNGTVGTIQTSGSSTTYATSSDQRLKENITDAPSASSLIDTIQVRSFDWKIDGKHQEFGMIAQELMEVVPDAVTQSENPNQMMGVDYSKLVPILVKEIQELRSRLSQLENVVNNN